MSEAISVALVTGLLSLVGVWLSNRAAYNKWIIEMKTSQAVTDTKIDDLRREVQKHNGFAERIPALEAKVEALEREVSK